MIVLQVEGIRKYYGPEPVLDGVGFDVRPGERLALVGPNGAGKTTLLRILAGHEEADAGSVQLHASATMAYLEQQPEVAAGQTVMEVARQGLAALTSLSHEADEVARQLAEATTEHDRNQLGKRFDALQHELHRRDAYHVEHRVHGVLHGLGFHESMHQQPVETLSGGQQNRLMLARLLLTEADLLLLDEPSNHLDIQATEWLEDHLASSKQAMILVSHDRYLLDKVATHTLELFRGTVDVYAGNFSAYWRQKGERLTVQRRTYDKQQEEIAKLEDFIRRNAYGQKAAQAEDRRKKLDRIERVALPREISTPPMGFPPAQRSGDVVLRVEHLSKSFDAPLFRDLTFQIQRAERWGVLGPNGSGKTTLLRCLLDVVRADEGRVIFGANVKAAYFDQHLSFPDLETPVVEAVRPGHKEFNEPQRRELLARFGLTGDLVFQKLSSLSGGERNRAALARLSVQDANLLVLDEPTNHLDLWARASLEASLRKFDGTVLFVSHDRYFLNQVADHLLVVEPGRFREIDGDYDMYRHLVSAGLARGEAKSAQDNLGPAAKRDAASTATDSSPPSTKRRRKFPYRKVPDIEAEIFERESRIEQLHAELGSPEVLRDGQRVKSLKSEIDEHQAALPRLYEHWEEATELN
ncbi:MAG: ABC-F family ATP-binding cassette domain-containing protein [Planctomycetales bacterium]|nr:ABC-F family ATP-binding cassette domain-containing protein [Planctomycetales bacterium]